MPYQGSMQTVRFQGREVYDDSDRQFKKAADVASKETEAIRSYERASGFDISEKQRQDKVLSSNDALRLKQLAQFSDGINKMMQVAVPSAAKIIAENNAEVDIENSLMDTKGMAVLDAEVKQEENKVQKGQVKASKMATAINGASPADANRVQLNTVTGRYTTQLLTAEELEKGFHTHLINRMDGDEWVTYNGERFQMKNAKGREQRLAVAKLIAKEYVVNNNPGLKRKILTNKLIRPITEKMYTELKTRDTQEINTGHVKIIDEGKKKLHLALKGNFGSASEVIKNFGPELSRSYIALAGDRGTGLRQMRQDILSTMADIYDESDDPEATLENFNAWIAEADLSGSHPGAKKGDTLATLYPQEFGEQALYEKMREARNKKQRAEVTRQSLGANEGIAKLIAEGNQLIKENKPLSKLHFAKRLEKLRVDFPLAWEAIKKAEGHDFDKKGYDNSMSELAGIAAKHGGVLPENEIRKLDTRAIDDFVEKSGAQIVDKPLGSGDSKGTKEFWSQMTLDIGQHSGVGKGVGDKPWTMQTALFRDTMFQRVRIKARQLLREAPPGSMSELQALKAAWSGPGGLREEIQTVQNTAQTGHELYFDAAKGTFPNLVDTRIPASQKDREQANADFFSHVDARPPNATGKISTEKLFLTDKRWLLPYNGVEGSVHPFAQKMARNAGEDPVLFVNNQIKLAREEIGFTGPDMYKNPEYEKVDKIITNEDLKVLNRSYGSQGLVRHLDTKLEGLAQRPSESVILQSLEKHHRDNPEALYGLTHRNLNNFKPQLEAAGIKIPTEQEWVGNKDLQKQVAQAILPSFIDKAQNIVGTTPQERWTITPNTLQGVETALQNLGPKPQQTLGGRKARRDGTAKENPAYTKWKQNNDLLQAKRKVLQNLDTLHKQDKALQTSLGVNYNAIMTKLGPRPESQGGRSRYGRTDAQIEWDKKLRFEVLNRPEFSAVTSGPDYGTKENPKFVPLGSEYGRKEFGDYQTDLGDGKGMVWVRPPQPENALKFAPENHLSTVLRMLGTGWSGGNLDNVQWGGSDDPRSPRYQQTNTVSNRDYNNSLVLNYYNLSRGAK